MKLSASLAPARAAIVADSSAGSTLPLGKEHRKIWSDASRSIKWTDRLEKLNLNPRISRALIEDGVGPHIGSATVAAVTRTSSTCPLLQPCSGHNWGPAPLARRTD